MTGKRKRYSAEFKSNMALEAMQRAADRAADGEARSASDDDQRVEEAGD